MSDTLTLKAQTREKAGSKVAARLRQQGQLPAIILWAQAGFGFG